MTTNVVDTQAEVLAYYNTNPAATIPAVAEHFGLKPKIVSAILAMHNIKVRRGAGNLTADARALGAVKRRENSVRRQVAALLETHGYEKLCSLIDDIHAEANDLAA